jgi:hypothetical protein
MSEEEWGVDPLIVNAFIKEEHRYQSEPEISCSFFCLEVEDDLKNEAL